MESSDGGRGGRAIVSFPGEEASAQREWIPPRAHLGALRECGSLPLVALLLGVFSLLAGCTGPGAPPPPRLLLGSSATLGDLYLWDAATGAIDARWKVGKGIHHIAVAPPAGEAPSLILIAAGMLVLAPEPAGRVSRIVGRFENRVDSVRALPGGELLVLEHPPGDPSERQGPHRLHRLSRTGEVLGDAVEVDARAYDTAVDGATVVVNWLQGRYFEVGEIGAAAPFERRGVYTGEEGERRNRSAVVRNCLFEPGRGVAWMIENAVGGDGEALALWRHDLSSGAFQELPLAARGYFQGGMLWLEPGRRMLVNGVRAVLLLEIGEGEVSEQSLALPDGFFHAMARDPRGGRIFLAGADAPPGSAQAGRIVELAADPLRVVAAHDIPHPVDRMEIAPRP